MDDGMHPDHSGVLDDSRGDFHRGGDHPGSDRILCKTEMIKSTMQLLRVLFSYIGLTEVRCGAGKFEITLSVTLFA